MSKKYYHGQRNIILILERLRFQVKLLLLAVAAFTVDAVEIECRFEYHTIIPLGATYTCMAASVTLVESTTLENVTGDHNPYYEGYTNDDVKCLWVAAKNLPFIPQGIVKFFKNLRALIFQKTTCFQ